MGMSCKWVYMPSLDILMFFSLILYLSLLLTLFVDGIKSNNKLVWILMMAFVGYALQAFLNIRVNTVAPTFYIIIGMMAGLISQEKVKVKIKEVV